MKFLIWFQRFMYGRYGVDAFYRFLLCTYIVLLLSNLFIHSYIMGILELLVIFILLFRFFSKNRDARSRENQLFLKWKHNLLKPFQGIRRNFKDKDHIYKKCHKCHITLKLPLPEKRGLKHTKCPKCGTKITLIAWKYQKIEIICKKKKS